MNKIIKNESEYNAVLVEIEKLIDFDPVPGTKEADRLELLTLLVKDYEDKTYPKTLPSPIDAILFRMEQLNLNQRDLIPYIGSRSKVSEILGRKRPLTMSMIQALHTKLGIPASCLLQDQNIIEAKEDKIEWNRFPINEMIKRGWIVTTNVDISEQIEKLLKKYFQKLIQNNLLAPQAVLYRQTNHVRSGRKMDNYALYAWTAQTVLRAVDKKPSANYQHHTLDLDTMKKVAQLSVFDDGPKRAINLLNKYGISVVIEPQLPKMYLDGAAIMIFSDNPIISMTLRYDRIDNFWFTLMHELAHIAHHMNSEVKQYYDDLEVDDQGDIQEKEADNLATEALISTEEWIKSPASRLRSPEAAEHLAKKLGINPAIVAGRMRYEFKAYRLLNHLVGHGKIRVLFPEIKWR
ncbi:MAG: ImmA/IrrE family metallo-endopeptidase [Proteobacteria bacterium]|nr:ImmA/IrrE family metallo-endopeptidase [Pseudomonadota bacterium]